ncbi:MAG: hypothetical protein ACI8UP_001991 [Porticoccaceae bacterium]|jgi:hypothetical protein
MNNALLLLSIALTALAGSICALIYSRLRILSDINEKQNGQILRLDSLLKNILEIQTSTQHCVSELSTEIQLRDVYKNPNDRHKLAINAAKMGKSSMELMRQHGLSSDEASLIISLHGGNIGTDVYQNANDKHRSAIKAAKIGKSSTELMRQYGLSSDEASLIVSLHGETIDYDLSAASVKTRLFSKKVELTEV